MSHVLLCQHGGSENHGCEALARMALRLVHLADPQAEVTLYSYKTPGDLRYMGDINAAIRGMDDLPGRFSAHNLSYHVKRRLGLPGASKLPLTAEFKALVKKSDLVVAIGGDNYCYNKGQGYYALDRMIKGFGKPYMLLGASIEPADLKAGLAGHLGLFDRITARESLTYEAMRAQNMQNVAYAPDPAVLLEAVEPPDAETYRGKAAVGVNLSPLIMKSESEPGIALKAFERLVERLLEDTDMEVWLIPHVVWAEGDDRVPLKALFERFAQTGRVRLVPDMGARQLKWVIAQLRFFIGARTHATIAAYSSGVPTLTCGYSIKAKGIATDLFGTDEGYVVPVQALRTPDQLYEALAAIMQNEQAVRDRLAEIMPRYVEQAQGASAHVARLLGR